ncbi:MAG: NAD-dependent malic enzyme [Peptococcaceae bacterium]|jgi:malate dehydrogenase (oxaloacetate-decarboxylating)|nr:NAD-dependent malic enzyme [Peptococcaceae bacterium]
MEVRKLTSLAEEALALHRRNAGKIEIHSKVAVGNSQDLSLAYTPGVAEPCKKIHENVADVYTYTNKGNTVAVVTDGTAVLGLGNIGPEAALPVMEGKAVLFKAFAGVDAFPICLGTTDPEEIIETVKRLEPSFGGINLEDIAAPNCFMIEERLKAAMNIPVFHDDQHGTAVVVFAALTNALKVVGKDLAAIHLVINGAGSAGTAICKLLLAVGVKHIILCDRPGVLCEECPDELNPSQRELAKITNRTHVKGTLKDALKGADVFIGVSAANALRPEWLKEMAPRPVIFAMANPVPEIMPDTAKEAGAAVVGTGRSDRPNQINNVLAFPGIFRGALEVRASDINQSMMIAAAQAIAGIIPDQEITADYILPAAFDRRIAPAVAAAVARAAMASGVARQTVEPEEIAMKIKGLQAKD